MTVPPVYVEVTAPSRPDRDIFTIAQTFTERYAPLEYETVCSVDAGVAPDICNYTGDPGLFDPTKSDTYQRTVRQTTPVTLYAMTSCNLVGASLAQAQGEAVEVLALGEGNALAQALLDLVAADASLVDIPITGGLAPDNAKIALAHAENAARAMAGGGVILMPTVLASMAGLDMNGTGLVTSLGTKVAIYETDTSATSWKVLAVNSILISEAPAILPEPQWIIEDNQYVVLAERPRTIGYPCVPVTVTVGT